jgi:hypothetical protein
MGSLNIKPYHNGFSENNVLFKTYYNEVFGSKIMITDELGFNELIIFKIDEIVAARITIPQKINRVLTLDILLKENTIGTTDDGGELRLNCMLHKHPNGGLSLWEEIMVWYSF